MNDVSQGMTPEHIARARLVARLHDPPEKALVLMRAREGHEGGTTRVLLSELFPDGLDASTAQAVRKADHWASAADRAAFPGHADEGPWPAWQQVRFADNPVLIHPLTGAPHRLQSIASDVEAAHAQALGTDHLRTLIHRNGTVIDPVRTALASWRFGPELPGDLANLWAFLPADSRVPDHTIHDHLDLTAALAGAFSVEQGGPALLGVSIGPVQEFIAAARTTSDLWAGSHLLSRLSWEAMRVVCETFGPESIIFPRLRGIPQVDVWLQNEMGLEPTLFRNCDWSRISTDANPLFAAALPNRFTALVPANAVPELTRRIVDAVRSFARDATHRALDQLLGAIGDSTESAGFARDQIDRQLSGFPEVNWAVVPWSLVGTDADGKVDTSDDRLKRAVQPFFGDGDGPGFLGKPAWSAMQGGLEIDKGRFWRPNPGVLYPALHELLERALGAVKATRAFEPTDERGWRCALTGETEWITLDPRQLHSSYRMRTDTLWSRVAAKRPAWARPGEHLGALPMLKRLWPELFVGELEAQLGLDRELRRYVVSTHTMALASAIHKFATSDSAARIDEEFAQEVLKSKPARVALPRKLSSALFRHPKGEVLRSLPGWLEAMDEMREAQPSADDQSARANRKIVEALGAKPDAYYGLLMLDGDHMGAWLSADARMTGPIKESFHPQVRQALESRFGTSHAFRKYADSRRPPNPAWHMAISEALNHFALRLAPEILEVQHLGRLLYAGGDDVLAMLTTNDLLPAAATLREAYSGQYSKEAGIGGDQGRRGNGWALQDGRVLRLMGERATASCGLVVAHHEAPLSGVIRELRIAERRAKGEGGRDAWSLTLLKRSGGALHVTAKWGALSLFHRLRELLARTDVSRRAAYNVVDWFADVPADPGLVKAMLAYRMQRQSNSREARLLANELAEQLVEVAFDGTHRPAVSQPLPWLRDFMLAAEFMAREARHADGQDQINPGA